MSKWENDGARVYEDGKMVTVIQPPEQAARIVALLNEGEADKRRLDWLEHLGTFEVECTLDNEYSIADQIDEETHPTLRDSIDAAIASESEPARRES